MKSPQQAEDIRDRWRRWLQTLSFFAVVTILAVVLFLSATVQHNERLRQQATAVAMEQTGVVQTRRWPTKHAFQQTGAAGETMARATWTAEAASAQETARPAQETAAAIALHDQQTAAIAGSGARQSTPVAAATDVISPESAGRVQQLALWGKGTPLSVLWSPDGRLLAVGTFRGVDLYELDHSRVGLLFSPVRHLDTQYPASCLCFSADGTELAVGLLYNQGGQVWDVSTGTLKRTVGSELRARSVNQVRFAPDGSLIVVSTESTEAGATIYVSLENGGDVLQTPLTMDASLTPVLSPDGTLLAYGHDNGLIDLQRVGGGIERSIRAAERSEWLAFSPDGTILAHLSYVGTLQLWRVADGTLLATLLQGPIGASGLVFSADGKTLVSLGGGAWEGSSWKGAALGLWSVPDGRLKATADMGREQIDGLFAQMVALDPSGEIVALVDRNAGQVSIWQADEPTATLVPVPQPALQGYPNFTMQLAFTPDGRYLLTEELGARAWLWDLATGVPRTLLSDLPYNPPLGPGVIGTALAADGSMMFTACSDGKATLWDVAGLVADGNTMPTACSGGTAAVAPVGSQVVSTAQWSAMPNYYPPSPFIISPGGTYLATVERENKVVLYSLQNATLAYSFDVPAAAHDLAFSSDGRLLAAGLSNSQLYFWQVADGQLLGAVDTKLPGVSTIALSPDDSLAAVAGASVAVCRVEDMSLAYTLPLQGAVGVAFSPDGRLLVVTENGGAVSLRRARDGELIATLPGSTPYVHNIAFSPDGRMMAMSSYDGTIGLWGVR